MTPRGLQITAGTGLLLAIVLIALSLASGLQSSAVDGPAALVVTPQGEVWVGVDKELWRASADGHLLHADAAQALGLPGPPSGLIHHPDGHVVASVRHEPTLYVLDPATAHVLRTITPRWPADLQAKGQDAINVAFAPDGRIAIATGGGHTVALFDRDGAFLARTAPGTYRYTNGLWWAGDALWTTDTNRTALRRLDGHTLAVQSSVELPDDDEAQYLGPARAAGPDAATVALVRFRGGMILGRVVLVHADGTQTPLSGRPGFEPVDVDWLGPTPLATDNGAWRIHRWHEDGLPAADFGDAAFNQRLQQVLASRGELWHRHELFLRLGVGLFVVAAALALVARRRLDAIPPDAPRLDLSRLGTPRPGRGAALLLSLRVLWPLAALLLVSQVPRLGLVRRWTATALPPGIGPQAALFAAFLLACVLLALVVIRRTNRIARLPEFEPAMNGVALRRLLATPPDQLPMAPGEHVLETFMLSRHDSPDGQRAGFRLPHGRAAARWVVCTNQGLRVFGLTGGPPWLDLEFALADVAEVSTQPPAARAANWSAAWVNQRLARGGWLALTLRDGRTLQGSVPSLPTHARVVALLAAAHPQPPAPPRPAPPARAAVRTGPGRAQAAIASALVPGLGQWWQRRFAMGLVFFVLWSVQTLALAVPLAWTVLGSRGDVSTHHVVTVLGLQAAYTLLAAWDAWRMARPRAAGISA